MKDESLKTIDGETLMSKPLKPLPFIVEGLLSQGLHILAGAPKAGKSWFALWLAVKVAKGEDVFGGKVKQGTTLYLCLEDSLLRIQNRLAVIEDEVPGAVHFATESKPIGYGLEDELRKFIAEHSDTVLVIIDTLQKVRKTSYDNTYATDYRDISSLKRVADENGIAILLIHHLRKEFDGDVFNSISGTTGIGGAADTNLVLKESKRGSGKATLYCMGRDIESRELELHRNEDNIWEVDSDDREKNEDDEIVSLISELVSIIGKFIGTPRELVSIIDPAGEHGISERTIRRRIVKSLAALDDAGIRYSYGQSNGKRQIQLISVDKTINPGDGKLSIIDPVPAGEISPVVPDGTLFSAIKDSSPETEGTESPVCDFRGESGATIPPDMKAAENGEFAESEKPGERPGMPLPADEKLEVFCELGRGQA